MARKRRRGRPPKPRPQKRELLRMMRRGMTANEIAARHDVSTETVRQWRRAYEITERAKGQTQISGEEVAEIRRLHDEGATLEELGRKFGRTRQGIHWLLNNRPPKSRR